MRAAAVQQQAMQQPACVRKANGRRCASRQEATGPIGKGCAFRGGGRVKSRGSGPDFSSSFFLAGGQIFQSSRKNKKNRQTVNNTRLFY